jgi:predicted PurR-regulated permease PerM
MVNQNPYQKIVPFFIFTLALLFFFMLVRPMITVLLSSILLAYITYPLSKRIIGKIHSKHVSIILSLLVVIIIILIPFTFLAFEITQEGFSFYNSLSKNAKKGVLFGFACASEDSELCSIINRFESISLTKLSKYGLDKQLQNVIPIIEEKIANSILFIPLIIAQIILVLMITYLILNDWENILKKTIDILPIRTKTTNRLIKEFGNITHTVIYAQLFVAMVQGIVGAIGFYVLGVPFPLFLGVVIAFCALIPTVGTGLVWIPASLYLIISGYFYPTSWMLGKGIILFFYGALVISTIDNFLLAKIVHERAKISQIVVIVGVIGGTTLFGVVGMFIGPILLPLLLTYFETFKERFV